MNLQNNNLKQENKMRQTIKNLRRTIKDYNARNDETQLDYWLSKRDEITLVLRNRQQDIVWRRLTCVIDESVKDALTEVI